MMKKLLCLTGAAVLFLGSFILRAQQAQPVQQGSHFTGTTVCRPGTASAASLPLPSLSSDQRKKVIAASLVVKLKTGQYHTKRMNSYSYSVTFQMAPSGWFSQGSYTLTVNQDKAQDAIVRNMLPFAGDGGRFYQGTSPVTAIAVSGISLNTSAGLPGLQDSLQLELSYDIEYGLDIHPETLPGSLTAAPEITSVAPAGKVYTFTWDNHGIPYPNYEFQLLRLYNMGDSTIADEKTISARVDWKKALTLETQGSETSLSLTIAEGQGYYLWRVRPVGSYNEGGIANDKNYDEQQWSTCPAGGPLSVTPSYDGTSLCCFFFTDPDDKVNTIYSRIFTEQNRVKESVTYANGLQMARQTQTYLPSKDTTLVIQNILDYSGRPAVTTLPVPVEGKPGGYKPAMVQSTDGKLYTADNFDSDSNYLNPSRMEQVQSPLNYYSDHNINKQIPDAEGYPFTRVLFYDDGTNRVKEQSGVGRMHMIGDSLPGHGGGKTVKTYYTSPSESELIRLFGDEAPAAQSVLKTITVDQNNTASVTYTTKEGQVIATSLVIQKKDNAGPGQTFDKLDTEPLAFEVVDTLRYNQNSDSSLSAAKRLVFLDTTEVSLDYTISCKTLQEQCSRINVDCGFSVKVAVHCLDDSSLSMSLPEKPLSGSCENGKKTASWEPLLLPPGTYIIEKQLLSSGNVSARVEDARDRIEGQIMPLTGMIKGWMAKAVCSQKIDSFYIRLKTLRDDLRLPRDSQANSLLDAKYGKEMGVTSPFFTSEHWLTLDTLGSIPVKVHIGSPCCELSVPVDFFPPFKCDTTFIRDLDNDGLAGVNPDPFLYPDSNEVNPDFEGHAIQLLLACPQITSVQAAQDTLQKYMNGWRPGEFNLMVYKMLTDHYNLEGREIDSTGQLVKTKSNNPRPRNMEICGEKVTVYPDSIWHGEGLPVDYIQYNCNELYSCWIAQVMALREAICINPPEDVSGDPPYNPSAGFDEQNGGNTQPHDDHFDNNIGGHGLTKWLAEKKISRAIRNLTSVSGGGTPPVPVIFNKHLVREFLECAGYRFAKIINPDSPAPLPEDILSGFNYQVPSANISSPPVLIDRKYQPDSGWTAYAAADFNPDGSLRAGARNLFPYVKDPVYAFKYFEYKQDHSELEFSVCYRDPNECWDMIGNTRVKVPCCATRNSDGTYDYSFCDTVRIDKYPNIAEVKDGNDGSDYKLIVEEFCNFGKRVCPITSKDWTGGQRLAFYKMLNTLVAVEDPFVVQVSTCDEMLARGDSSMIQKEINRMNKGCLSTCEDRRSEFANELRRTLESKCYIIGGCKGDPEDRIVPLTDFNIMVDSMVAMCKGQCNLTTFSCTFRTCRYFRDSPYNLGYSRDTLGMAARENYTEYGVGGGPGDTYVEIIQPSGKILRDCSADPTHSYCEFYKYNQVMTWTFELDVDSKCDGTTLTVSDTAVDCPAGNTNPAAPETATAPDVYGSAGKQVEYSNQFRIDVNVQP